MNKRTTKNFQPEPKPNSEQKADDMHVRPAIGNTNVGSCLAVSTKELFPISERLDLSFIDYHFSVRRSGDEEVRIPYVPLYNYLRCVEMLQAAEYQISVLQEAVSKKSQENQ